VASRSSYDATCTSTQLLATETKSIELSNAAAADLVSTSSWSSYVKLLYLFYKRSRRRWGAPAAPPWRLWGLPRPSKYSAVRRGKLGLLYRARARDGCRSRWGALTEQGEAGSGLGRRPLPCQCGPGAIAPVWVS
jgi:hypothetical protein